MVRPAQVLISPTHASIADVGNFLLYKTWTHLQAAISLRLQVRLLLRAHRPLNAARVSQKTEA